MKEVYSWKERLLADPASFAVDSPPGESYCESELFIGGRSRHVRRATLDRPKLGIRATRAIQTKATPLKRGLELRKQIALRQLDE